MAIDLHFRERGFDGPMLAIQRSARRSQIEIVWRNRFPVRREKSSGPPVLVVTKPRVTTPNWFRKHKTSIRCSAHQFRGTIANICARASMLAATAASSTVNKIKKLASSSTWWTRRFGTSRAECVVITQLIVERHGFRGLAMKIATTRMKGHS
jgi:hypothetical protein